MRERIRADSCLSIKIAFIRFVWRRDRYRPMALSSYARPWGGLSPFFAVDAGDPEILGQPVYKRCSGPLPRAVVETSRRRSNKLQLRPQDRSGCYALLLREFLATAPERPGAEHSSPGRFA